MRQFISIFLCLLLSEACAAQYNWKPELNKDGISVFLSERKDSRFKAIKVECVLSGSYDKLINILTDVTNNNDWVYNSITNVLLKKTDATDFIYYTETKLPWPLTNRDAIIHIQINKDSLPGFLTITGTGVSGQYAEKPGRVRISQYSANWKVTSVSANKIHIRYIVEVDPGGNIPAWISNMFVEKGPYETFKKLAEKLKK